MFAAGTIAEQNNSARHLSSNEPDTASLRGCATGHRRQLTYAARFAGTQNGTRHAQTSLRLEIERGMATLAKNSSRVGPRYPQVVVLVGATGDLSRRKLLPGLFHLVCSGFIPGCRIIGVSLEEFDALGLRKIARE